MILGGTIRGLSTIPSRIRGESQLIRHLSYPLLLEQAGPPILVRVQILLLVATILGFLFWATITQLKETVQGSGEVIPSGSVIAIQHLEGGIVSKILVRDGDLVETGDILIRLDSSAALARQKEIDVRGIILEIRAERLMASAENRGLNLDDVPNKFSEIVRAETAIFTQNEEEIRNELRILRHQRRQRIAELDILKSQVRKLVDRVHILSQQKSMRESLLAKGLVSKILYFQTLVQHGSAVGELEEIRGQIVRARSTILEVESKIKQVRSSYRNKSLDEAGSVAAELASVRETAVALRDRVKRLEVTSPVRGIVKGLTTNTVGGVVQPGGIVSEIVPIDEELIVEVRINPLDIGHIRKGQKADIKITTYDFSRFGSIEGHIINISGTTFKDREGEVYYKANISLKKTYVGTDQFANPILPGMITEISIKTGERTLLEYLLKPIFRSFDAAFSER